MICQTLVVVWSWLAQKILFLDTTSEVFHMNIATICAATKHVTRHVMGEGG